MRLPRSLLRTRPSRGQALVEFALILPLLALLLVMAIDFGRVFFGRIAIENAARIGADFAAGHAGSWEGTTPVEEALDNQALYRTQIAQDLQALNCELAGDPTDPIEDRVPEPNFDPDGDGTENFDDGSLVRVTLDCEFGLITPLAETFFGGPVSLSAESEFPINGVLHTGLFGGAPPPPPVGCEAGELIVPDLVGLRMQDAKALWDADGFTGTFSPAVTNPNKNKIVLTQSLSAEACELPESSVTVTHS